MGKKLPNELWARPVASKLSVRRPLTFFHRRDTENGKKRYFFAFLQITPMQKFYPILSNFIQFYPRVPYESRRPGDSENVVVFYSIIF